MLHLTLKGARVALLVGGLTSLIVIPLALLFGMSAPATSAGASTTRSFFVISTLASMPGLLLLIALIMALGRGPLQVCVALGVTGWVGFCRVDARRDAQAARARLRAGGARARRLRARASSGATSCRT